MVDILDWEGGPNFGPYGQAENLLNNEKLNCFCCEFATDVCLLIFQ